MQLGINHLYTPPKHTFSVEYLSLTSPTTRDCSTHKGAATEPRHDVVAFSFSPPLDKLFVICCVDRSSKFRLKHCTLHDANKMGSQMSQMFPPSAKFTEKELPDQAGKVRHPSFSFIINCTVIVSSAAN